jgi:hypothetical protein
MLNKSDMEEKLVNGEIIIRICPFTEKVVLAQYEGNDEVLCLHNDTIQEDIDEVMKFIKKYI